MNGSSGAPGPASVAVGLALAILGALLVLTTRQGTPGAALAGAIVAGAMALGFGAPVIAPLALFVLGSGALTRAGRATKERLGAAEPDRGRRDAPHVLAKLAVPALLGVAAAVRPEGRELFLIGAVGALAGAFADTAATEIGPLAGGPAARLEGGRLVRAKHGETGGVSAAGLLAAAAAALAAGVAAWSAGAIRAPFALVAAPGAGWTAALAESAAAGTAAGRALGHLGRNAALSAVAALLAMGAARSGLGGSPW